MKIIKNQPFAPTFIHQESGMYEVRCLDDDGHGIGGLRTRFYLAEGNGAVRDATPTTGMTGDSICTLLMTDPGPFRLCVEITDHDGRQHAASWEGLARDRRQPPPPPPDALDDADDEKTDPVGIPPLREETPAVPPETAEQTDRLETAFQNSPPPTPTVSAKPARRYALYIAIAVVIVGIGTILPIITASHIGDAFRRPKAPEQASSATAPATNHPTPSKSLTPAEHSAGQATPEVTAPTKKPTGSAMKCRGKVVRRTDGQVDIRCR